MQADTRIATLFFIVPFSIAVCIVAVESELSTATFMAFLTVKPVRPDGPEAGGQEEG